MLLLLLLLLLLFRLIIYEWTTVEARKQERERDLERQVVWHEGICIYREACGRSISAGQQVFLAVCFRESVKGQLSKCIKKYLMCVYWTGNMCNFTLGDICICLCTVSWTPWASLTASAVWLAANHSVIHISLDDKEKVEWGWRLFRIYVCGVRVPEKLKAETV